MNVSGNADYNPYPGKRNVVYGRKGMVATSQPLAAEAGLDVLKKGGNAVDAAVATAACLTVVEPTSNGIGSDCFAIVWINGELHGLNGSGQAPEKLTIEAVNKAGYTDELPTYGMIPVTVPGTPGAWAELISRFGKLSLAEVLAPAIEYAEQGFPLSPTLAKYWDRAYKRYSTICEGEEFQPWFDTFAPEGRAPRTGEIWNSPGHADTLRELAETNASSFYHGKLAEQMISYFEKYDGLLQREDLAKYKPEWVKPISVNYRGYQVWEMPPNCQGIIALEALNLLKGFDFKEKESVETYHKQIEAIKLAFCDGLNHITDPAHMSVSPEDLLSDSYIKGLRKRIGAEALSAIPETSPKGGTVYLATADENGNMVSFIQSNYMGFGSGIVIPGTGIAMQNRGHNFSLNPDHCNALGPDKRSYHTIIPGFLTKGHAAIGPFGLLGGFIQPQGHVQLVMNLLDFGLNPQAALDAPRWMWEKDKSVHLEHHFPNHIAQQLAKKGHAIRIALDEGSFGRGQIIWRDPETGVYAGGTESRTDGAIAVW